MMTVRIQCKHKLGVTDKHNSIQEINNFTLNWKLKHDARKPQNPESFDNENLLPRGLYVYINLELLIFLTFSNENRYCSVSISK